MSCNKVQTQDTNCPVCQLTVNVITRYGRNCCAAHYFKTTSCCGKLKAVHHKCAIMFSSKIDSTYEFEPEAYAGDNKIKFLRINCSDFFSIVIIKVTVY